MVERADAKRISVWMSMADHFLDTETRHDIPLTAMLCIEAGLSREEARLVWQYEVSPAVGFNAWDMAGEWAAWHTDWLVERIDRLRRRWDSRPGTCRWLRYRVRVHFIHNVWVSIGRCMDALLAVRSPADREAMSKDLAVIGRHYFDSCPEDLASREASERERIRKLYPEPFRYIMKPAIVSKEEEAEGNRRMLATLSSGY